MKYKTAKNPNDKLWYAVVFDGKFGHPVSDGFKSKQAAQKWARLQNKVDAAATRDILTWDSK